MNQLTVNRLKAMVQREGDAPYILVILKPLSYLHFSTCKTYKNDMGNSVRNKSNSLNQLAESVVSSVGLCVGIKNSNY